MDINTKKLTPKQTKALQMLLSGASVQEVSDAEGISRQTIYDWLNLPHFQKALEDAQTAAINHMARRLIALGEKATRTLSEAMDDPEAGQGVRIRAADIVFNRLTQFHQIAEIEKRIMELEEKINAQK